MPDRPCQAGPRGGRVLHCVLLGLLWLALAAPAPAHATTAATAATTAATAAPAALAARSHPLEAGALVLALQLDDHVLSDSLNAYQDGRHILLPLGELARLLTLAITVSPELGSARGYLLREDSGFGLSVADATVSVDGRERVFEGRLAQVIDGDIYVASQLLQRWLPIDFEIDLSALQLQARPRTTLPLQARLARERAAAALGGPATAASGPGHDRRVSPVALAGVPFIDQTFGGDARLGRDAPQFKVGYTAYLTGDLLGLEGAAYLTSSRDKPTPDLRVTLGRNDPDAGLLGPLRARSFQVGSISLPSVPNVMAGSAAGAGLLVGNRPLGQAASVDRHDLRGDLLPGWDVTLYYNDALAGYQAYRPDGRYAFDELPLAFGPNEFRLVFNGPLGQVRVERHSFLLDQSLLRPGELLYAAAWQPGRHGPARSLLRVDLGLTKSLAALAALVRKPDSRTGATQAYAQLGLRAHANSLIASAQLTSASAARGGGWLAEAGLKTRLGGQAVDFSHTQRQRAFESDVFTAGPDAVRWRDALRVNGPLRLPGLPPMSLAVEATRERLFSGASSVGASGRLSAVVRGSALTNTLRWHRAGGLAGTDGSLQLSRRVLDIGLNAQWDYTLLPAARLQSVAISGVRNLADGYRINAGLLHSTGSPVTLLSAGLNKNLGRVALALSGSYSTQRERVLGVQLFVSMGHDPRSGRWFADAQPLAGAGAVSARAFVDRNLNGMRDPDEELVPNAGFIINGGGRHPRRTDSSGSVFIGRLPPGQYADIALDPATLEDPQWRPLTPGVRVLPRPGVVEAIEFPVVSTSEIDGTVYLVDRQARRGIGAVRLELVDEPGQVVATTHSSPDGFYLFHQVVPGRLVLRIAPDQAAQLGLTARTGTLARALLVPADGDLISGQDFELQRSPR